MGWALIRLLGSEGLDRDVLRDVAPFVYAGIALAAVVQADRAAWRRSAAVLGGGLFVHAAWVTIAFYRPETLRPWTTTLGERTNTFEIRSDFDGAVLALLAALGLHLLLSHGSPWRRLLGLVLLLWPSFVIFEIGNRGALLSLITVLLVVLVMNLHVLGRIPPRVLVPAVLALVAAAAVVVPSTNVYQRLTGGDAESRNSSAGTTSARELAWRDVLDYTSAEPARLVAGVGFGPDFLVKSGARVHFGGFYTDVRAAHNSLINTYARLGLVGIGLLAWVLVQAGRGAWRLLRASTTDTPSVLLVTIPASLLVASLVGVILESPFGAVPIFWAVGRLCVELTGPRRA
nr:O-antigen ligase family protein [Motilibacter aurantiacus]